MGSHPVLLRETRHNRYSLNALAAILSGSRVPWAVARTPDGVAGFLASAPRAVVLYSFMTPALEAVRDEVLGLRARFPRARWVAGGPHPTADPEGTLALGFDHVFAGEAERTLPRFLSRGEGDRVIRDPDGGPRHLDPIPPLVPDRPGPVEISRGCRGTCRFCSVGRRPVRHRSPGAVLEAARVLRRTGRTVVRFITPDALAYGGGLGAVEELLRALRAEGMEPVLGAFPSEVRPERVTPAAAGVLARYCHNRVVVLGGQSGSDAVLRRLRRGHGVADVVRAALTLRGAGLSPHVDLIFGLPGESPGEQAATVSLARRLIREAGARIHAHYFHPLPGTPFWSEDPAPLYPGTLRFLESAERGGALDGSWRDQARLAARVRTWADEGLIRLPRQVVPHRKIR